VSGPKISVAIDADSGEIVKKPKVVRLVAFPEEDPLTVITPSLEVLGIVRVLNEPYSAIPYLNMMSTHDRRGSLTVSLAANKH
jgi:hypothetical protein